MFVKYNTLKVGDHLQADGEFFCLKPGAKRVVRKSGGDLYVSRKALSLWRRL